MNQQPLSSLRNLGAAMEQHGHALGIHGVDDLKSLGYMAAYLRYRAAYPRVMNRMALYALYGALTDQDCMRLPQAIKDQLEKELQTALSQQKTQSSLTAVPLHELP